MELYDSELKKALQTLANASHALSQRTFYETLLKSELWLPVLKENAHPQYSREVIRERVVNQKLQSLRGLCAFSEEQLFRDWDQSQDYTGQKKSFSQFADDLLAGSYDCLVLDVLGPICLELSREQIQKLQQGGFPPDGPQLMSAQKSVQHVKSLNIEGDAALRKHLRLGSYYGTFLSPMMRAMGNYADDPQTGLADLFQTFMKEKFFIPYSEKKKGPDGRDLFAYLTLNHQVSGAAGLAVFTEETAFNLFSESPSQGTLVTGIQLCKFMLENREQWKNIVINPGGPFMGVLQPMEIQALSEGRIPTQVTNLENKQDTSSAILYNFPREFGPNYSLLSVLRDLEQADTPENRRLFYQTLLKSTVLVPIQGAPKMVNGVEQADYVIMKRSGKKKAITFFTDRVAQFIWSKTGGSCYAVPAENMFKFMKQNQNQIDDLLMNCGGPSERVFLPHEIDSLSEGRLPDLGGWTQYSGQDWATEKRDISLEPAVLELIKADLGKKFPEIGQCYIYYSKWRESPLRMTFGFVFFSTLTSQFKYNFFKQVEAMIHQHYQGLEEIELSLIGPQMLESVQRDGVCLLKNGEIGADGKGLYIQVNVLPLIADFFSRLMKKWVLILSVLLFTGGAAAYWMQGPAVLFKSVEKKAVSANEELSIPQSQSGLDHFSLPTAPLAAVEKIPESAGVPAAGQEEPQEAVSERTQGGCKNIEIVVSGTEIREICKD